MSSSWSRSSETAESSTWKSANGLDSPKQKKQSNDAWRSLLRRSKTEWKKPYKERSQLTLCRPQQTTNLPHRNSNSSQQMGLLPYARAMPTQWRQLQHTSTQPQGGSNLRQPHGRVRTDPFPRILPPDRTKQPQTTRQDADRSNHSQHRTGHRSQQHHR